MSFEYTSRNISIVGSVLRAECRDWDRNWKQSSLDLNQYIGSTDGAFSVTRQQFASFASNVSIKGSILSAKLRKNNGGWNDASFDLNLCIAN